MIRRHTLAFVFVALSFAVVAIFWSRIPDPVPVHWDIRGEVNGWMAKPWGAVFLPLTALVLTGFFAALPALSPKSLPVEKFGHAYASIVLAIAAFLFVMTLLVTLVSIGVHIDMTNAVSVAVGALFAVLGNFMSKVTRNRFVGIRTPWTLASDEVWLRTHRVGSKTFVAAGLATCFAALFGHGLGVLLVTAPVAAIVPVVYSYLVYRRVTA